MCHNNRIPKLYSLESFHDKFNKFSWYLIFQRTCYPFSGLHNYIVCQKTKPKKKYLFSGFAIAKINYDIPKYAGFVYVFSQY